MKNYILLGILLCASVNVVSALQIIRGPYLQLASSHSITIRWRTDSACTSIVSYGLSDSNLNNTYTNIVSKTEHIVTLNNLAANTVYYYAISGSTIPLSSGSQNYFKTAPITSSSYDKPIRFWALGDISKQTQQQIQVRDAFIQHKQNNYIDGWILLGDNAYEYGYDWEYQNGFFNYYQNQLLSHLPLYPVVGNHDYANDLNLRKSHAIAYFDIFSFPTQAELGGVASNNPMYYSFNYGNVHFIQLDSYGLQDIGNNWVGLTDTALSPQISWLKQDLESNFLPWTIVSFHHPPYCFGNHNSDNEVDLVAIRNNVLPILERYNVDLVLNGHDHTYQRSHFMQQHYGLENSFDSLTHIRQFSSGRYDGSLNSCAYVKNQSTPSRSDSGTIYAVIGSGSAIPSLPQTAWPHDAMSYSNYADNGSLLLTIEGNKLTGEFISIDSMNVVKDKFTLFKQVGIKRVLPVQSGTIIQLSASWPGSGYVWSTGDTTRTITVPFLQDATYYVSDSLGCIRDTFIIQLPAQISDVHLNSLSIYPNPTSDKFTLESSNQKLSEIKLFTLQGQLLVHEELDSKQSPYQVTVPSSLQEGVYFLQALTENGDMMQGKVTIRR